MARVPNLNKRKLVTKRYKCAGLSPLARPWALDTPPSHAPATPSTAPTTTDPAPPARHVGALIPPRRSSITCVVGACHRHPRRT